MATEKHVEPDIAAPEQHFVDLFAKLSGKFIWRFQCAYSQLHAILLGDQTIDRHFGAIRQGHLLSDQWHVVSLVRTAKKF